MGNGYIKQARLVIVLALCCGAALAGMQMALSGRIRANKQADLLGAVPYLVPGAEEAKPEAIGGKTVYRALAGGKQLGWVIPAAGQGFADRIELLIGLDIDAKKITGLYVLDQKETPGLGNRIIEPAWRKQFVGTTAAKPLEVVKAEAVGNNQITAVTGATISSDSVCQIVNQAMAEIQSELSAWEE